MGIAHCLGRADGMKPHISLTHQVKTIFEKMYVRKKGKENETKEKIWERRKSVSPLQLIN